MSQAGIFIDITSFVNFTWNEVTGAAQAAAESNGYVTNNAGVVTVTLPATAAFGTIIKLCGKQGTYVIAQNAGQQIRFEALNTTVGVVGTITSTAVGDCIELLCTTADTNWTVLNHEGTLNVV